MSRAKRSMMASLLLALLLLLLAAPVGAQWLPIYLEPTIAGVQDGNGVYISDVVVTWTVEPDWVILGGCEDTLITEDTGPEGVDLWCYGTTENPDEGFGGEVNIVRQAAPAEQSFIELKAGIEELESDEIINLGQAGSLDAKLEVAEIKYGAGELMATSNVRDAFQNELVGLAAVIDPQWHVEPQWQIDPEWSIDPSWVIAPEWLLAEALIRVVTPSM
jgi:hypothetical protein